MLATPRRAPGRMRLTGYAVRYMLLCIPAVALFCVHVVFLPLTIITVGVLALQVVVPLVAGFADLHRRMAERILGEPVPSTYRPVDGRGLLARLTTWAKDPARWRDLGWLLVAITLGWAMAIAAVVFFFYTLWCLVYPLLWWLVPGVFDEVYGLLRIDTWQESFVMYVPAAVSFLLWWFATPALVRTRARVDRALLTDRAAQLRQRVQTLTETRADTVDASAAELRRIERDLHDGAQARLVSLGMSLGLADEILADDPEAAKRLLAEARETTTAALGDLRSVVRGIHPPVLADRGLGGAVEALALDMPLRVTVTLSLPQRLPAPVESAAYFAVAECLANIGKHSGAGRAWVRAGHADGVLSVEVGDNGVGGADLARGTGLRGIDRRLAAFDGTLSVSSPRGGPTVVSMEVPCAFSSPKTSPSSGTV